MKRKFYIKILFSILISLFISQLLVNYFFVGNTSYLRSDLPQSFFQIISSSIKKIASIYSFLYPAFYQKQNLTKTKIQSAPALTQIDPKESPKELLKNISLSRVTDGIYLKENIYVNYLLIKEEEVEWLESQIDLDGKKVYVKLPKGEILR